MKKISVLFWVLFITAGALHGGHGDTDVRDASALRSVMNDWQNSPPSWGQDDDPCSTPWEGVVCQNSRVTVLRLSTMGLKGTLSSDISQLAELQSLDLSYNDKLGGPIPPSIGNLLQLTTLILAGCSFSGNIPQEIGSMEKLSFLALNSNQFTGRVPPSLGLLSSLYWLDLADNQLTGPIPISSSSSPGLDLLVNTKHFHFNKNQLSGKIPGNLFSSQMTLIHLLLDSNKFTGEIPGSIGLVTSLEVLRLDRNYLIGPVPSTINNLTRISELNLANNQLSGPMPNLTGMNLLNYVDLSNNSFLTEAPTWFTTIESLTVLVMESGGLYGNIPPKVFSSPQIQQVLLANNDLNGILDLGQTSSELQIVNLQNNAISGYKSSLSYNGTLVLVGNPVCSNQLANSIYCSLQQEQEKPYSTSLGQCNPTSCYLDLSVNPQSCACAYPYQGMLIFRAPFFRDVSNPSRFQELERYLWTNLNLTPGSVYLSHVIFNDNNYLELQLKLFPPTEIYFTRLEIQKLGFYLSNQTFKPPAEFGPYYFIGSPYAFPGSNAGGNNSMSIPMITGIIIGCIVLVIVLAIVAIYAFTQKKRAERAVEQSKPFASWVSMAKDSGGAPQLKGARWFSFDELKKSTESFSEGNAIGSGGYGKVYLGIISNGEPVAIKRAQEGSMQGAHEFKTEIELLSRVHHKNLVSLVGFCFEQGEQMLVYEYIPNGTLRESLTGRNGIQLSWTRRLKIALGSARGLAYLHELANPPIIHRDVKSTNILLDGSLNAKVADFGLSKLVSDTQKGHISTHVKGTLGYLDPEYYMTQQLTEKSDVYSFGVVMLELITGKQPIEKGKYIVRGVRLVLDDNDEDYCGLKDIMDPAIQNTTKLIGFRRFVELSMQCVNESAANRPTMNELVKEIEAMLQNEGLNTNLNSATSSATDFGNTKGARHPYDESLPRKDMTSNAFKYSGGLSFSPKVEPK